MAKYAHRSASPEETTFHTGPACGPPRAPCALRARRTATLVRTRFGALPTTRHSLRDGRFRWTRFGPHPPRVAPRGRNAGFTASLVLGGLRSRSCRDRDSLEAVCVHPILVVDLWVLGSTMHRHLQPGCASTSRASEKRRMDDRVPHSDDRPGDRAPRVADSGSGLIVTILLYWQWWHTHGSSWGISGAYRRGGSRGHVPDGWLDQAIFYAIPVYESCSGRREPLPILWLDLGRLQSPTQLRAPRDSGPAHSWRSGPEATRRRGAGVLATVQPSTVDPLAIFRRRIL